MGWVSHMIQGEELKDQSRKNEKDFTRTRKVGFVSLICLIFNMVRKSTQLELDEFRERFMPSSAITTTYTKQSFSEARQKLSTNAFKFLNEGFIREFYIEDDYKTYKGFRLLAVDGCVVEVPNTLETQKQYGFLSNGDKTFKLARALSSHLVDIENKLAISTTLGRYDDNERNLAQINIEKMLSLVPSHIPNLILFDRGYPSAAFIQYLLSRGVHFLMRVSTGFYKEVVGTSTQDETVQIVITKERAKELRAQRTPISMGTILTLRVLKVILSNGETEILITDVGEDQLSQEDGKSIYFKRWGIETRFDELKHQFETENFSGETPTVIEQDFYATTLLSNIASLIEQDAQEEMQEKNANKTLKYDEYKINHNILVGKLKNRLVEILLEENNKKKDDMYQRLIAELERNIVPVIRGRSFLRKKQNKANKYVKSKRRCY
jgi:hypothetical protein